MAHSSWRRSCGNKVAHTSENSAINHAVGLQVAGKGQVDVYKCQYCGKWHVGRSNGKVRQKKKAT